MTNAVAAFRSLIVYALVVPLALVMGYLLATPTEFSSWATVGLVLLVLCTPLLLKWHHPLLFLSWNMTAVVFFLPGRPQFWLVMAFGSLLVAIVQRTLNKDMRFISAPSVLWPVVFIGLVVVITARFTGGFGMRVLGSESYGGKRYLLLLAGIAGFLAMIAHRIPREKAMWYVGLFFLGGLANAIGSSVGFVNPLFYFLFYIFPVETNDLGGLAARNGEGIARYFGLSVACIGAFSFLLARYGIRNMLGWNRLWRLALLAGTLVLACFGGFRSIFAILAMTFLLVFYFEGLFRSKYGGMLVAGAVLGCALLVPLAHKLPLSIQRSLSFLPLEVDPVVRYSAQGSTEWRVQMWQALLPEVPRYFWFGKGLGISGRELNLTSDLARMGAGGSEGSALAGDYHNGPLSTIIAFGVWGAIGLLWLLAASIRALYLNHLYGDESLRTINTLLLAYFISRALTFLVIAGGFYTDIAVFAGIVGLSLSLNGGICQPAPAPAYVPPPRSKSPLPVKPALPMTPSPGLMQ